MRVHNLDVRCKPVLFAQNETIFTRSTNLSPCTNEPVLHTWSGSCPYTPSPSKEQP